MQSGPCLVTTFEIRGVFVTELGERRRRKARGITLGADDDDRHLESTDLR
jgi:hypothetical protein